MAEIDKTPLKLKDIPTKNQIRIIDNYSPTFNYIVEDDKVYYSLKGRDHWVDISDNTYARTNLLKFLNDNYDFRGYEDREREIYGLIQKGTYDWKTFGKETPAKLTPVNKPKPTNIPSSKPTNPSNKPASRSGSSKLASWFRNAMIGAAVAENPYVMTASGWTNENGQWKQRPEKAITVSLPSLKVNNPGDIGTVWNKILEGNFQSAFNTVRNGISRRYDKMFGVDKDPVTDFLIPGSADTSTRYALRPGTFTGDTIRTFNQRVSPLQYIIPESVDVNEYTFGYRNRGDYTPINTEAASITAFRNFKPYGRHDLGYKTYIGIDKNGNLKVGDISQFSLGDFLTGTYSNEIASFLKDKNGNIVLTKSIKNPALNLPAYVVWDNGKLIEKPNGLAINILVRKDDPVGNLYGNVTGGRVLVKVGNELRLLSGSVRDIDRLFEDMKKRNGVDHGTFYTLDNGSFNRGLRTYNLQITSNDLRRYDDLNSGGGNFLYLLSRKAPVPQFRSDTIWTPNIRTVNDESYKKGHGLVNEQKGIVLHHTGFMDPNLRSVTDHLTRPNEESAHVIIGFDGSRRVLARPDQVTFHAGQSAWNKRTNVNDFMVGIEFLGDTNRLDLTQEQIDSAVEYMTPIIKANNIRLEDIVTHQQIRDLYNDYAKKNEQKTAPSKPDINQVNYARVIEALKRKVYYEK